MMRWAFPTSAAYVPEVSISMYTAWVWLRWSVQVDTENPSSDARSRRLTMIAPLRGALDGARFSLTALRAGRLHQALDEQWQHDGDVVRGDQHPEQLPHQVAEDAQQEPYHAHQHHQGRSPDRAQRVNEGFERDRHESQGEGQNETENHLRRGRDEPEQGIGRRRLPPARERLHQRLLVGRQHVAHQGKPGFDSGNYEDGYHRDPEHTAPHALARVGDDREQVRDAKRLHHEQAHRRLEEDDDEGGHVGSAQRVGQVVPRADQLGKRKSDQFEVDERPAYRDQQDQQ